MRGKWILRAGAIALLVVVGIAVFSFIVMSLWNWLVPAVIGWKAIDFWQALGLLVLTRLLFGFRGFGGWHHRGHGRWKQRMQQRWMAMTPEEREKFRDGMRARCKH
jgi:hypothetical protein